MILNNYWKYLAVMFNSNNLVQTEIIKNTGVRNTSGVSFGITAGSSYYTNYINELSVNLYPRKNTTVRVGTGDTAVTADDYDLANDVTNALSNVTNSQNLVVNDEGKLITTYLFSATNNTGNELTIKEVGIHKANIWGGSNGSEPKNSCFLARKILDNPITVPNGTSFTVNFVWEEN